MLNLKHKPFDYDESESPCAIAERCKNQISEELSGILERLGKRLTSNLDGDTLEEKAHDIFLALPYPEEDDLRKDIIRASSRAYAWVSVLFIYDSISIDEWHQLKVYILALTEDVLRMAEN